MRPLRLEVYSILLEATAAVTVVMATVAVVEVVVDTGIELVDWDVSCALRVSKI